jgi:DNA-binding MarR family transcriptional regulator
VATLPDAGATLAESLFRLASLVIRQRPRDISLTAASTLTALERNGPRRLTQLALGEGIAQPSMTALVAQLEGLGLVERHNDPSDGRVVLVAITREGSRYLKAARRQISDRFSTLLGELSAGEVAALRDAAGALRHLADLVEEAGAAARGAREEVPG